MPDIAFAIIRHAACLISVFLLLLRIRHAAMLMPRLYACRLHVIRVTSPARLMRYAAADSKQPVATAPRYALLSPCCHAREFVTKMLRDAVLHATRCSATRERHG